MWAFAILAHNPGSQLLDAVSKDVHRRLDDFSPQHIAVTLWAFGKLEASPGAVLLQVSPHFGHILTRQSVVSALVGRAGTGCCLCTGAFWLPMSSRAEKEKSPCTK